AVALGRGYSPSPAPGLPAGPSGPQLDLGGGPGAWAGSHPPQLLGWLSRLSRSVGQPFSRPPRGPSLERHAGDWLVLRRRHHGPRSQPPLRDPGVWLRLAPFLGPAHG